MNELFYYDESSPSCLRWKVDRYGGAAYTTLAVKAGEMAGSLTRRGYWNVEVEGETFKVHRIILEILNGRELELLHEVDHVNGNTMDNRVSNLRLVTSAINARNLRMMSTNKSGKTGVFLQKREGRSDSVVANWYTANGKQRSKGFSVSVHGEDAYRLAAEYRDKKIAERNKEGAGYTDRHGT